MAKAPARPTLPVLRTAMLCQQIVVDRNDRPFALFVPIHVLRWPHDHPRGRPYAPPTLELYAAFTEGNGDFHFRIVLRRFDANHDSWRSRTAMPVNFVPSEERQIPEEFSFVLTDLAFPEPGAYDLIVYANHVALNDPFDATSAASMSVPILVLPPSERKGGIG
jgi:hypothetical protein